jgi:docosahexaenoic acid omega-hydroxylase
MLAMFPEVQQKVVDEMKEVFGSVDAPIDFDSLNRLTYLDLVVKETMRLFPVLPVSARETTDEVEVGKDL